MDSRKHYLAAITAFVLWGFFSIPLRAISSYPVGEILYFRIFFSALLLAILVFGFRRKQLRADWSFLLTFPTRERRKIITLTIAGGLLLIVNWLLFIYVVNSVNIKTASFSYMICPVITAILGFLLLQEQLSPLQWLAVALCAVSCVLIGISSVSELIYSFLTALVYALYMVSQRRNQGFDRLSVLGLQVLLAYIVLNFFYAYLIETLPSSGRFYLIMVMIAVVFTIVPLFLNLYALNRINAATIGILLYLNPIFNFTVAFVIFKEEVNIFQVVGYAIIVVAVILFNHRALGFSAAPAAK